MKTRVPINHYEEVEVRYQGHTILIRFRPNQRKVAKYVLIRRAFELGWVIPMDHYGFALIEQRSWEDAK